ncbi:MAG: hypothetical protein R6U44_01535 [Archaeoglobaceae archaeon]
MSKNEEKSEVITIRIPNSMLEELKERRIYNKSAYFRELAREDLENNKSNNPDKALKEIQKLRDNITPILQRLDELEEELQKQQQEHQKQEKDEELEAKIIQELEREIPTNMVPKYREKGLLEGEYQKIGERLGVTLQKVKSKAQEIGRY